MSRIRVGIDIDASPATVWEIVEPVENHVDWMHDAVAIRFETEQTRGVGTRFLCDTKVGPIRLTDQMSITAWVPERSMGVTHTGVVTGSGTFDIAPLDGWTRSRFTWSEELRFPWFLGGPLGAFVGGQLVMKAIWRRNLRGLKRIVEAV